MSVMLKDFEDIW